MGRGKIDPDARWPPRDRRQVPRRFRGADVPTYRLARLAADRELTTTSGGLLIWQGWLISANAGVGQGSGWYS